jgi:HSP20 family protein
MTGLMRREPQEEASDVFGRFERLLEEWMRMMMPFRLVPFSHRREGGDFIRVEEFREDETLVIRADLPGIDPEKDTEVTVSDGVLRIEAERRTREEREEEGYLRQEVHYGSLSRSLPLPAGVTEAGITAAYQDGVLEIRIPAPRHEEARKVAISRP